MAPAPLPLLRRMVFGKAWYDRWAKESPSMTSNGRCEGLGLLGLTARICRLISPPIPRTDFLAFDEAVVAVAVAWPPTRLAEEGWSDASRSSAHTGAWSLAPLVLVCDRRRRRFADAPSKRDSAECGRCGDLRRFPSADACNPKMCTLVLWDGAREWRRSSPAREGADTRCDSQAAAGRRDPRTSSDRCLYLTTRSGVREDVQRR
jgi:hypothetical protein